MTEKSPNKLGRRPGVPSHPAGAVSISDRYEIVSADSFPASNAPSVYLIAVTVAYLTLVEIVKHFFYRFIAER